MSSLRSLSGGRLIATFPSLSRRFAVNDSLFSFLREIAACGSDKSEIGFDNCLRTYRPDLLITQHLHQPGLKFGVQITDLA